jgi:hypothetical protein
MTVMWFVFAALQQMGFRFSPEFIKFLITKSDLQNHKHMSVDQFIVICIQVQRFTGKLQLEDDHLFKKCHTLKWRHFKQRNTNNTLYSDKIMILTPWIAVFIPLRY